MLRSLAELLSRGHSFRRRLPKAYGGCRMYVSPECGLSYWFGLGAGKSLFENAAEIVKPGNVVWDVGANMGLFSFAAAGLAGPKGRVYCFEPDAILINLLRQSAQLNSGVAPVEVIPCAVSDEVSLARFHIAKRSRASNFLEGFGASQSGGFRETQTVLAVSLDWMAERIPPPDVLKVDVEGAEASVFRGAARLLALKHPTLIFESHREISQELSSQLLKLDYTLYDSELPVEQRKPLPQAAHYTLALPA